MRAQPTGWGTTALRGILLAAVCAALVAGNGWAEQSGGPKPAEPNPAVAALTDELALLEAQLAVKQTAVKTAEGRLDSERKMLKRLEAAGTAVAKAELEQQKAVVDAAKADVEVRGVELTEQQVKVRVAKRKLEQAVANPPKAGGASSEESLAKLVQLMTERNQIEKDWTKSEAERLKKELKDAEARAKADADLRDKQVIERQIQEKTAALRHLPDQLADTDLRLRAAELKREQIKLELEASTHEIARLKAGKTQLEALKATLEKDLKPGGKK